MKKEEVIEKLCEVCSMVGNDHFKNRVAHDCFCGARIKEGDFQFDEEVLLFIYEAVIEKIKKE